MKSFLESVDIFREPVYLRIRKYDHDNGSSIGGCISVMMFLCLLSASVMFFTESLNPDTDIIR